MPALVESQSQSACYDVVGIHVSAVIALELRDVKQQQRGYELFAKVCELCNIYNEDLKYFSYAHYKNVAEAICQEEVEVNYNAASALMHFTYKVCEESNTAKINKARMWNYFQMYISKFIMSPLEDNYDKLLM